MKMLTVACCLSWPVLPVSAAEPAAFVGYLDCSVSGRSTVVASAFDALKCRYKRADGATEYYEGYTGFEKTTSVAADPHDLSFEILSSDSSTSASLQGEFDYHVEAGEYGGQGYLSGGSGGEIILKPVNDRSIVAFAALSKVAGLSGLHLNYAGVTHKHVR